MKTRITDLSTSDPPRKGQDHTHKGYGGAKRQTLLFSAKTDLKKKNTNQNIKSEAGNQMHRKLKAFTEGLK